jgi:hypothetical protein
MTRQCDTRTASLLNLLGFSFNSLSQAYGRAFVQRIVLRHPLHTLRGLLTYRHILGKERPAERLLFRGDEDDFIRRAAGDVDRLLVGTGFCQKPLRTAGGPYDCPAGRFNHDCSYLSRLELHSQSQKRFHEACTDCSIRVLGSAALKAGASFAVLTSALDIANDILLPSLQERRFTRVLFAICPYSVEPMSLALLICSMEGATFHYDAGSCTTYRQWLRADAGDKTERTALSRPTLDRMLCFLDAVAVRRPSCGAKHPTRYEQVSNVFRPC